MSSGIDGETYKSEWTASGTLTLVQINPLNGQTIGSPYEGVVSVGNSTEMTNGKGSVDFSSDQREVPDLYATRGLRIEYLRVREAGKDQYTLDIQC
jgi:hypothetical protein